MNETVSETQSESQQTGKPVSMLRTCRETIEALGIALVFVFLLKAYFVELYCIPTGSMASTLMGRHKDVNCEVCGFPFQIGASQESTDSSEILSSKSDLPSVIGGTCPQCQYTMYVGADNLAGQTYMSFNGDRIVATKSLFSYREPSRWHVTIFRYPAHPQVNYIKRLIGLENETVMFRNGQVFVQKEGSDMFEIQRKPLGVLLAMLRPVDDNDYVIPALHELGWKTRWYGDDNWQRSDDYKSFTGTGGHDETSWLKFRYITATTADWNYLIQGKLPEHNTTGKPQLITDTVAYNSLLLNYPQHPGTGNSVRVLESPLSGAAKNVQLGQRNTMNIGLNWVGDLVIRCTLQKKQGGVVTFRLVKGGINFQCDLDFTSSDADTHATFSIPEVSEFNPFTVIVPVSTLSGEIDVMFCNVDEEMRLVINGQEIDTQGRGRYDHLCLDGSLLSRDRSPTALDLEPAAIGVRDTSVRVEHLKIERNLYYISCDANRAMIDRNCDLITSPLRYDFSYNEEGIREMLSNPARWRDFGKTQRMTFKMGKDQFLMCGDNSAESKDSRLWTTDGIPHYVERKYLIGEALCVFWPHGLRIPGTKLALIPNFSKMRRID